MSNVLPSAPREVFGPCSWGRPALLLVLLCLSSSAAARQGGSVSIGVTIEPSITGTVEAGQLRASPLGGVGHEALPSPVEQAVSLPSTVALKLEPGLVWLIEIEAEGTWSASTTVAPGNQEPTQARIHVLPAGKIRGHLGMPRGQEAPQAIGLRFQGKAEDLETPVPERSIDCPIQDGAFECVLPAVPLDLRLRAKGYISHYFWGVQPKSGRTLFLGTLDLHPGASVAGRIELESPDGRKDDVSGVVVELLPVEAVTATGLERQRFARLALKEAAQESGFFHLAGVPPGAHVLEAHRKGYAPARIFPLIVEPGAETEIRAPLILRPPLTATISIDPPVDLLGRPWSVSLRELSSMTGSVAGERSAKVPMDGVLRQESLAPGRYWLSVDDADGLRMAFEEVELTRSEEELSYRLDLVWVEGTLSLDGEPLAADLWFGGQHGPRSIHMIADEEGVFTGVLPEAGRWPLEIAAREPRVERRLDAVVVPEDQALEIDLPGYQIAGTVHDEEGKGVAGAFVRIQRRGQSWAAAVESREDGTFTAAGLDEGQWVVFAEGPSGASEAADLTLPGSLAATQLQLILRPWQVIEGVLRAGERPVPGAQIWANPLRPGAGPEPLSLKARTNVRGRFRLEVPEGVDRLQVLAFPPGHVLTPIPAVSVPRDGALLELQADTFGGTLSVQFEEPVNLEDFNGSLLSLRQNEVTIGLYALLRWAEIQGERNQDRTHRLRFPDLLPGNAEVCNEVQDPEATETGTECRPIFLAPLTTTGIDLPGGQS